MNRLSIGDVTADFVLPDHEGNQVRLSNVLRSRNVLLVFNLGFL